MVDRSKRIVVGIDGSPLTLADLPVAGGRWTPKRKADLVLAVQGGLLGLQDACDRYQLTVEEFAGWQGQINSAGLDGLKVSKIVQQRRANLEDGMIG